MHASQTKMKRKTSWHAPVEMTVCHTRISPLNHYTVTVDPSDELARAQDGPRRRPADLVRVEHLQDPDRADDQHDERREVRRLGDGEAPERRALREPGVLLLRRRHAEERLQVAAQRRVVAVQLFDHALALLDGRELRA